MHIRFDPRQGLHLSRALRCLRRVEPVDARIERNVFRYREIFVQSELLRHVSDVTPDLRRVFSNIHTEDAACSFGRPQQTAKSLDDRRFARAVWTKEAE